MSAEPPEQATLGRKRDPRIEDRVTRAAIEVYASSGWRGLTFDAVKEELDGLYTSVITDPRGRAVRELTRRAVARGELPSTTPATLLPDMLLGAFFIHWAYTEDKSSPAFHDGLDRYAERLVTAI